MMHNKSFLFQFWAFQKQRCHHFRGGKGGKQILCCVPWSGSVGSVCCWSSIRAQILRLIPCPLTSVDDSWACMPLTQMWMYYSCLWWPHSSQRGDRFMNLLWWPLLHCHSVFLMHQMLIKSYIWAVARVMVVRGDGLEQREVSVSKERSDVTAPPPPKKKKKASMGCLTEARSRLRFCIKVIAVSE